MANTDAIDDVFTALADPTRRAIINCLRAGPLPVGQLASNLPVSRPAVSQHLRVLSDAGLLRVVPVGNRRVYHLAPNGMACLRDYLDDLWDDALRAFSTAAQTQKDKT